MLCKLLPQLKPCTHAPVCMVEQVCLFSYGQTGAGKTHTMQGSASAEGRGITPRALEQVCPLTVRSVSSSCWTRNDNQHLVVVSQ